MTRFQDWLEYRISCLRAATSSSNEIEALQEKYNQHPPFWTRNAKLENVLRQKVSYRSPCPNCANDRALWVSFHDLVFGEELQSEPDEINRTEVYCTC